MATAEIDVPQLAAFCSVPESSISTLLDEPTTELVQSFLLSISAKAQDVSQLTSRTLKLDVELENAVRGGESKARLLKSSVDKAQKDTTEAKQKLQSEQNAREALEEELNTLKTSSSATTSEVSTLQARVATLESSNRDTLSLLNSKSTAYDNLVEDLNIQHRKLVELRKQSSELEQAVQAANTAASAARFHEQGLQQEIEQLKRTNDWLDKELKAKSEEFSKYRKEKSLRIGELSREHENATTEIESLRNIENSLRRRIEELGESADNAFQRIQRLEESSARKEESFKIELDAANRLQELTKKSADTEHLRQQDLLAELDAVREEMSEQTGKLAAEAETEHQEKEAAETRAAELEVQFEQLENEISSLREQQHRLATPQPSVNGFAPHTPSQTNAAAFAMSPGSARSKGGLSMTQLYSNFNDMSRKFDIEKRRNEELAATIDNMISEMELHGPEIEETRVEKSRLESEVAEISALIDSVGQERDQAVKSAKRWEGQVKAKATESDVLRQQLRDLSSQIKVLLMEAHLRSQGQDEISPEERARLEQIANGQDDSADTHGQTATARFISENLVTFKSVSELQDQNVNLLKITREVGERMEHEEALRKQTEAARDWEDLQQKYERCKDEIKALATQSQSYIRERDMFRRMLSHRGQIPKGHESMFDESIHDDGDAASQQNLGLRKSIEGGQSSQDHADYGKLLREFQAHFDAYKQEAETDKKTLKEQMDSISKDNSSLRNEAAKSSSQVTLAHERYEMLQANYAMLRNENSELQKRAQTFSDNAAKQDLRVQQVAEDLIEARGLVDSMRNETANLKAEKEFWKTIEKRINEDNEALVSERTRLNSLNANLQNLLNEKEHSDGEVRRRLHSQVESLDKELQSTKSKLAEESEETKRTSQRREYESEKNQKRIDDLVTSLGSIREELVEAKTTRDHLSARVEEMTIQLRSAEERVTVLQATPNATSSQSNTEQVQESSNDGETNLSKEQELSVQVSELKRDLDLSKAELVSNKDQIDQYKAISQASEDELASLNSTQDLYRTEMEKVVSEKDSRIKELDQRMQDVLSELASTNTELSQLRNEQAEFDRRLETAKNAYEAELAQVKDDDERHAAAAKFYQEDLKVQADIAQQAQSNYESELLKHADAAKALQKVRTEHNQFKLEVVEVKTELETARTNVAQTESSLIDSRDRYEREISELKSARTNLKTQNDHLHQQLENFNRRTQQPVGEDTPMPTTEPGLQNLQEVIKYLRREKEIVDVQLELASQEAKRLRQQLDYTHSQLDETRLRLNQQRRQEAESERMALDHNKLMETINDLNTLRESNVTLRAESRQAQSNLASRTKELEDLKAHIDPLEIQIRDLAAKCEAQEGEAKLLKENSDRWQQRAQNVLQKYDRVDPAELEALKEQLKTTETARDELTDEKQALQEQVQNSSVQISEAEKQAAERVESMRARLTEQFKSRSKLLSDRIKEKEAAVEAEVKSRQELEQQLSGLTDLQSQLESVTAERDAAIQEKVSAAAAAANQSTSQEIEEGQVGEDQPVDKDDLQKKLEAAEAAVQRSSVESSRLEQELAQASSKIAELERALASTNENVESLNTELSQLRSVQQSAEGPPTEVIQEQVVKLQGELLQAQQDAEKLRATASISNTLANSQTPDGEKSMAEQVAEHVETIRADLEAQHKEKIRHTEEILEKRTKNMKDSLQKKLQEGKAQARQEFEASVQNLKREHESEIQKLNAGHREELEELRRAGEAKLAETQTADQATNDGQASNDRPTVKTESENPSEAYQPSEQEIRSMIQNNATMRGVMKNNVIKQVNIAKEELTTQLKTEHEKDLSRKLADAQSKSDLAKEQAISLASKKTLLQLNLQANKAKLAEAKLDIVQKSAQQTPQKPVIEVWNIAKDVKPAPSSTPQQQQQQATPKPSNPTSGGSGQPSTAGQPSSSNQIQVPPIAAAANTNNPPVGLATFGRPSVPAQATQQPPAPVGPPVQPAANSSNVPSQAPEAAQQPTRLNLPRPPSQPAANSQINAGTGPAVLKSLQSGLPVAAGGSGRGFQGGSRGRGSGIPRGGPQSLNTARDGSVGRGRSSPTTGPNPAAKQFVPGNKRPRDESQDGGGDEKRIRGAGVAAGSVEASANAS